MIYKKAQTVDTELPGTAAGNTIGNTTTGLLSSIPFVGLAMQAGRMVGKAMPKDENGNYKNDISAGIAGGLNPFGNIDKAFKDISDGHIGKGIMGIIEPISGQVNANRERQKEIANIVNNPIDTSFEVGNYNPLAGKIGGVGIDVNKTITDKTVNFTGAPEGVTAADAAVLASNIYAGAGRGDFKMNKNVSLDKAPDIDIPKKIDFGERLDELDMEEEAFLNNLATPKVQSNSINLDFGSKNIEPKRMFSGYSETILQKANLLENGNPNIMKEKNDLMNRPSALDYNKLDNYSNSYQINDNLNASNNLLNDKMNKKALFQYNKNYIN